MSSRDQILGQLRERIVAFAASRIQKDTAEDLAQEVLIVLEEKYQHVEELEELLPLSLQIVRYKMLGVHRKSARRGEYKQAQIDDMPLADPNPDPEALAARRQLQERLRQALTRLDGRCRELFRLKLEGKTFAEIQGILGAGSLNTVYTWDFRCRKQLLKWMGGKWEARR